MCHTLPDTFPPLEMAREILCPASEPHPRVPQVQEVGREPEISPQDRGPAGVHQPGDRTGVQEPAAHHEPGHFQEDFLLRCTKRPPHAAVG